MQEQELEATATTYTALVSAYCKSDNLDAALEVCLMNWSGMMQSCMCTCKTDIVFHCIAAVKCP